MENTGLCHGQYEFSHLARRTSRDERGHQHLSPEQTGWAEGIDNASEDSADSGEESSDGTGGQGDSGESGSSDSTDGQSDSSEGGSSEGGDSE